MNVIYQPILPREEHPVVIIGAGGIVRDAHLPAYQKAGFPLFGIADPAAERAESLARQYHISHVFSSVEEAVAAAPHHAVYDIATMPEQYLSILNQLPDSCAVLLQKPMGDDWVHAQEILETCRRKNLVAAVNFQLRYAPFVSAARWLIQEGYIGELYDMEVRVTINTPWELFPKVKVHPRLEILYHSIHYIDLIRSFLGNPESVMAKTLRHPVKQLSSSRSTILMDYGDTVRAVINTNHDHDFGAKHQESFIKWEGTTGAIRAKMGLLMNYPHGLPDHFEFCLIGEGKTPEWKTLDLDGSWFPEAFIGSMASLMRYKEGSSVDLPTRVEDAICTMAVVENAYRSSREGGAPMAQESGQKEVTS